MQKIYAWLTTTLFAVSSTALAVVPGAVDLNRVGEAISQTPIEDEDGSLTLIPLSRTTVDSKDLVQFTLKSLSLSGQQSEVAEFKNILAKLSAPYVGKSINLDVVNTIAEQLEDVYRERGYLLAHVSVPKQQVKGKNAHLYLMVKEGRIITVGVKSENDALSKKITTFIDPLKAKRPVLEKDVERQMLLVSDAGGIAVQAKVTARKDNPGDGELEFNVERRPNTRYVTYNNRGNHYIGPRHIKFGADLNTLFGLDHLDINYATTLPKTHHLENMGFDYSRVLGTQGNVIHVESRFTRGQPEGKIFPRQLDGRNVFWQADVGHYVIRQQDHSILVTAGGYFINHTMNSNQTNNKVYNDRIRTFFAEVKETYKEPTSHRELSVFLRGTQGISIFGSSHGEQPILRSNLAGRNEFFKVNAGAESNVPLPYDFHLNAKLQIQYSFAPLLLSEQMSVGGPEFGLAYDVGEDVGDRGFRSVVTIAYHGVPNIWYIKSLKPFAFYDLARLSNIDDDRTVTNKSTSSWGLGANFAFTSVVDGSLTYALPMSRVVESQGRKRGRLFFEISSRY